MKHLIILLLITAALPWLLAAGFGLDARTLAVGLLFAVLAGLPPCALVLAANRWQPQEEEV